ncbi:retrovirus-related pol polyprotein from transposon TNT 1-94 [Tanacetum coccineum]
MKFNNKDAARFDKKKVKCCKCSELGHFARECTGKQLDSKARYSSFKLKELDKTEEPNALLSVDSMLNWSDHKGKDVESGAAQVYGMIAGAEEDAADSATGNATSDVADDVSNAAAEFALMGISSQAKLEKLNDKVKLEESKARFDKLKDSSINLDKLIHSSMSSRSNFSLGFGETFGSDERRNPLYDGLSVKLLECMLFSPITGTFCLTFQQAGLDVTKVTLAAYVPAGSRNRPTSVSAGRPFSAGWKNHDNPHKNKDLGIVDSGCSRSMTGNKEKLDGWKMISRIRTKKQSQNDQQNRTRNGKVCERQSQIEAEKAISQKVNRKDNGQKAKEPLGSGFKPLTQIEWLGSEATRNQGFADCHFNEAIFPSLGGEKKNHEKDVSWSEPSLLYLNPHTKQSETEVQKIMHMQEIANQLPDAFIDPKRVTKSYISVVNALARVEIPDVKYDDKVTQESKVRLKRGRPVVTKDKNPRKRKATKNEIIHEDIALEGTQNVAPPEKEINDINKENKWKEVMQAELNSLNKRKVFGRVVLTPEVVKPVGYRWIFIRKQNKNDEVIRYKARLIAQGFSHRPRIDYEETYSPVMDAITFRYLISLAVSENLDMRLMDVVTAYLYRSLNSDIYMKIPKGFKMPEALSAKPKDMYSVKLQRSLYRSLNVDNDLFHPCEEDEDVLGPEVPYLSAIRALMYLTNCTRLDFSFAVNLLARLSYLSDPHKARSQTGYVFLNGGTAISWCSQKKTLVATSSNHVEVIALHEASRECVWLRSMTQLIVTSCVLNKEKSPTIIYEDNAACVAQIKEGYIKSDRMKYIPPRYSAYTQDLIKDNQIEMKYVQSSNNLVDLLTKALPTLVFKKHVHAIGMQHVQKT